jgi:short subunit dehydrogenase-like uncharacterized protein
MRWPSLVIILIEQSGGRIDLLRQKFDVQNRSLWLNAFRGHLTRIIAAMGRVILFGATGYTGRITAAAMVRQGLEPVLAGRSRASLDALAASLEGAGGFSTALADAADPASVRGLLDSPNDVLVSTVGPFTRFGGPALAAAIDAGAAYVDSTGEPSFVRKVFEHAGPRAEAKGARLLTAFGYDYVPGNLAGAIALRRAREAGRPASRVDVGYFVKGGMGLSSGTRASAAGMMFEESFAFRGGELRDVRPGGAVRSFDLGGQMWDGLPLGGSEHFTLPRLDTSLNDVGVYLGWAGKWTKAASFGASALGVVTSVPGVRRGLTALSTRGTPETGQGPNAEDRAPGRSIAIANAYDPVGRFITSVKVVGPTPYDLTAELLTWGAEMLIARRETGVGALGPADAFGVDELVAGCAGLKLRAHD